MANTPPDNDKPNVEERYTQATHATNLRVQDERGGAGDLLIAVGWSPFRLGAAMLRLHSEWDGAEKPEKPTAKRIHALAATVKDIQVNGKTVPGFELVDGKPVSRDLWAYQEAHRWYEHELGILMGKLKTLPEVRNQVAIKAYVWHIPDPWGAAAAVIKFWLDQTCQACDGQKYRRIPGTPSLSTRPCGSCFGSGLGRVPYRDDGKRLANYMDDCVSRARQSIKGRLHESMGRV